MSRPVDSKLYQYIKSLADKKFKSKTGIYKSSWIVKEYKRLGGEYEGNKPKKTGLKRWYKEKWIDLNRPIKDKNGKIIGYEECGRKSQTKGKYPLCRPSIKVNSKTPRTYKEISKKSIQKAKLQKSKVKSKGNIKFGGIGKSIKHSESKLKKYKELFEKYEKQYKKEKDSETMIVLKKKI